MIVMADERRSVKAGLELTDGAVHMSTVITREYSDRVVVALPSLYEARFGDLAIGEPISRELHA